MEIGLVQLSQSVKTTNVTHTLPYTQTDKLNNGTLYAPRYEVAFLPKGKNGLGRFVPSALPYYEEFFLLTGKKRPHQETAQPKAHYEIHSRPATATNSRLRAAKQVPRGSLYSHASSIDPWFVEIGLVCIVYMHTRTAAAVSLVFVLVLYLLASAAPSAISTVIYICISAFGAVRWCLTLSLP